MLPKGFRSQVWSPAQTDDHFLHCAPPYMSVNLSSPGPAAPALCVERSVSASAKGRRLHAVVRRRYLFSIKRMSRPQSLDGSMVTASFTASPSKSLPSRNSFARDKRMDAEGQCLDSIVSRLDDTYGGSISDIP